MNEHCFVTPHLLLDQAAALPVVAHPPCQLWGGYHNKPGNDGDEYTMSLSMG